VNEGCKALSKEGSKALKPWQGRVVHGAVDFSGNLPSKWPQTSPGLAIELSHSDVATFHSSFKGDTLLRGSEDLGGACGYHKALCGPACLNKTKLEVQGLVSQENGDVWKPSVSGHLVTEAPAWCFGVLVVGLRLHCFLSMVSPGCWLPSGESSVIVHPCGLGP